MQNSVCIAGAGVINAAGSNLGQTLHSLRTGSHGIRPLALPRTVFHGVIPAGQVQQSDEELLEVLKPARKGKFTRTALLGMAAASEAVANSGIDIRKFRCALISATSVGGMDCTEQFYDHFIENQNAGRLRDAAGHDCSDSTMRIAAYLGISHYINTISTACSSSANSIMLGARLLRLGLADVVVAGGTDSVTRFTLNGFNTLMILDKEHCKPFDKNRAGLNLGEGAGFVVMARQETLGQCGAKAIAKLAGYANANDAYHQTASSPEGEGAYLAMSKAVEMSGLQPGEISYINVHGTGTQNNDLSEGIALKRVFGDNLPPFSSTKAFTGHTLGAAGGVEAVISILALVHNQIFPNLNFREPIDELQLKPVTELRSLTVKSVLSNSFGFGGNNSTLIFKSV